MYSFTAYGHKNILATHKTTVEFTKDKELSLKGNCIVGVRADFDLSELKKSIKTIINKNMSETQSVSEHAQKSMISDKPIKNKIKIIINLDSISDEIVAELNPDFDDDREIVIRMGEFKSKRTLGIRADKAAVHVKRELIEKLKNHNQKFSISFEV